MHWDVRLAEANLVVADLLGAVITRKDADEDGRRARDRA
jgi:hypothetical protein